MKLRRLASGVDIGVPCAGCQRCLNVGDEYLEATVIECLEMGDTGVANVAVRQLLAGRPLCAKVIFCEGCSEKRGRSRPTRARVAWRGRLAVFLRRSGRPPVHISLRSAEGQLSCPSRLKKHPGVRSHETLEAENERLRRELNEAREQARAHRGLSKAWPGR
jgi:hypothetical protein